MTYAVSVRSLCSFTAKRGDLDNRFTPAPSAHEGIQGHRIVASRRGPHYKAEVSLKAEQGSLTVRGRADGYDEADNRIDECKTFRGDFARIAENRHALHWAQAQTYGAQLCRRDGLPEIELALVYFDIDEQEETVVAKRFSAAALDELFVERCEQFSAWAEGEMARLRRRDASLVDLKFPYQFHSGQRQLADAVYRAAARSEPLLAQAPTGVGKTLGTLYPSLKALSADKLDKIFYLTAKGTGRKLALDALRQLQDAGADIRVLDLIAREKACVYPGKECNGDSCPLARGFYDRLAAARVAASELRVLDGESIRAVALAHQVCPYYLSQEMVKWCDVVIADYNHYFDHGALLHTMTLEADWRVTLLVDEAHNLIDRARDMYTCSIDLSLCHSARKAAPASLQAEIAALIRSWEAHVDRQETLYAAYDELPREVMRSLKTVAARIGEIAAREPHVLIADLRDFYFAALQLCRLAETFAEHSIFDIHRDQHGVGSTLSIRCVVPGAYLRAKFEDSASAVLFSATLSPPHFYRDLLGLPKDTAFLDAPSPFRSDQLQLHIASDISTRYRTRLASLNAIVELIERQLTEHPGNYLFFASSFEYLSQISMAFTLRNRSIRTWSQQPAMTEKQRVAFINKFADSDRGIAFAVLGGSFAEGIDLVGDRLVGVFVATIGLPQLNPITESMAQRMEQLFGQGFNYTYLYPGLRKVIQAVGRVVRSKSDFGHAYLIDQRYGSEEILSLLPSWWAVPECERELNAQGFEPNAVAP